MKMNCLSIEMNIERKLCALLAATALLFTLNASAAGKLTVLLDWYVNPDHAPLYVAQAQGYFEEVGLDVEFIAPANPNDPPKLVAAKRADLAITYQPQLHLLVHEQLPLVRVGTLVATPLNCIVVLDDSDIRQIKDLKGRKIGYSVSGFEDVLLAAILESNGLSVSDVTLINVNFSLSPAVMSGQVDAVIGAFRNFELNQMDIEGRPGRAFYLEEEGIPAYDELVLVAHRDSVADIRMRKFIDALERAVQFLVNHPEQAWQDFISFDKSLDNELNKRAWHDTLPRFALRPGALDEKRYQEFAKFLEQRQLISQPLPVNEYAMELN